VDGVVVDTVVGGFSYTESNTTRTFVCDTPVIEGKKVDFIVTTAASTAEGQIVVGKMSFNFTDVPAGQIGIPAGLQVAYADNGRVKLSEKLPSLRTFPIPDTYGLYYVWANLTESGAFDDFSLSYAPIAAYGGEQQGSATLPAFTEASHPLVGTPSTNSAPWPGFEAWRAFNRQAVDETDGWLSASGSTAPWDLTLTFTESTTITGYTLTSLNRADSSAFFPKTWEILMDGVVVDSRSEANPLLNAASKKYFLDAPVRGQVLTFRGLTGHFPGGVGLGRLDYHVVPKTQFEPARVITRNDTGTVIRRVQLGLVFMANGVPFDIVCEPIGRRVVLPCNKGSEVGTSTIFYTRNPFAEDVSADLEVDSGFSWEKTEWIYASSIDKNYGSRVARVTSRNIGAITGENAVFSGVSSIPKGPNLTSAKMRLLVKRGF